MGSEGRCYFFVMGHRLGVLILYGLSTVGSNVG